MLEAALKSRAAQNDAWWIENEPRMRRTSAMGLRYLVIQAYAANLTENISGIEAQLADYQILRQGELATELAELARLAYPQLSESAQDAHQRAILSLLQLSQTDGDGEEPSQPSEWRYRWVYGQILSIPAVFRTEESQRIVTEWQPKFGTARPEPEVYMWGGGVSSPVPADVMQNLSTDDLVRLMLHYTDANTAHDMLDDGSVVGGRRQLQDTLHFISSRDPRRFLELVPEFLSRGVHRGYVRSIAGGIADHVRFRAGTMHPSQGWKPREPLVALETLAQRLLAFAETNWAATPSSRDEIAWDGLLDACCSTLRDEGSLERLTWLLFRFLFASDPELEAEQETRDLDSLRCNSTRGKAAEAATRLCCYCLRDGIQIPRPLPILLQHFAGDQSLAVRVAVLEPLGFLLEKQPELGWGLLERTLRDQPGPLARYAEPILHRQYHVNFPAVAALLKRIRMGGLEQGGSTYGRILTLAHLAGHVTRDVLLSELETTNEHVRKGAAQVFCANIANPSHRESCDAGLRIVVEDPACPKAVIDVVERSLRDEQSAGCFDFSFAASFVTAVEKAELSSGTGRSS